MYFIDAIVCLEEIKLRILPGIISKLERVMNSETFFYIDLDQIYKYV